MMPGICLKISRVEGTDYLARNIDETRSAGIIDNCLIVETG